MRPPMWSLSRSAIKTIACAARHRRRPCDVSTPLHPTTKPRSRNQRTQSRIGAGGRLRHTQGGLCRHPVALQPRCRGSDREEEGKKEEGRRMS
eukprot:CAMPEP_0114163616 /NCGR_PEP_ID=MMETSP0043_2-20121206/30192_1 /TAXON_ID=464988 /ORGANISM="Hemiselmis andersenii, Strain CCMP644" /LENGTH=92 /DNA_ID=CAMNT_0001260147 /DNA_START=1 /DNA_END=275 /DNA_ORIENTATION=-